MSKETLKGFIYAYNKERPLNIRINKEWAKAKNITRPTLSATPFDMGQEPGMVSIPIDIDIMRNTLNDLINYNEVRKNR